MSNGLTGVKAWLKRRGYHLLFAGAIFSLAALVLWWSVFLRASIEQQHEMLHENLVQSAAYQALVLGNTADLEPLLGEMAADQRLVVAKVGQHTSEKLAVVGSAWPDYCIVVNPAYHAELEDELRSKTLMVTGESSLLLLVVLICVLMLWRMMRLEMRSHRELNEFWSRVTHEIKTPITGIKAFLQTLQQREFTKAELEPLLKMALREVERQEMLAENLLMGQRIEVRNVSLQSRPIVLAEFVREFLDEHKIILPDDRMLFELDCPENTCVIADLDGLRVILENLTDNALKYGGTNPKITFKVSATVGMAAITVRDDGLGFEPSQADMIFEAYHRLTKEQPKGKHGTGMGMHLSRQLARKMGGDLMAFSKGAGKGASFIVTLKRAQEKHG